MFELRYTGLFKRDFKRIKKRNYKLKKNYKAFEILKETGTLPVEKYKTHTLSGNWNGYSEAHIENDWLIIWLIQDKEVKLIRTGTHSDLF